LIDKRELLEKARKRNLNLGIVEKDYILGWLLFGFSETKLIFKGGTALSKIYFPKIWRLSEDLDFSMITGSFNDINIDDLLRRIKKESGIRFRLKNRYENPEYLQLKIQYSALLGKNWAKVDVTKERVIEKPALKSILGYSDYPSFSIKVMCLEEIFAEKLRALLEREKTRDYYDIWRMLSLDVEKDKIKEIFIKKCGVKGIEFKGIGQFFPDDLKEILKPYWERELSRLIYDIPNLKKVIEEIKIGVRFLE